MGVPIGSGSTRCTGPVIPVTPEIVVATVSLAPDVVDELKVGPSAEVEVEVEVEAAVVDDTSVEVRADDVVEDDGKVGRPRWPVVVGLACVVRGPHVVVDGAVVDGRVGNVVGAVGFDVDEPVLVVGAPVEVGPVVEDVVDEEEVGAVVVDGTLLEVGRWVGREVVTGVRVNGLCDRDAAVVGAGLPITRLEECEGVSVGSSGAEVGSVEPVGLSPYSSVVVATVMPLARVTGPDAGMGASPDRARVTLPS